MISFVGQDKKQTELVPLYQKFIPSEWGNIRLQANEFGLCGLGVLQGETSGSAKDCGTIDSIIATIAAQDAARNHVLEAEKQLIQYFTQQRQQFDLQLAPKGTVFQRQVWQSLLSVSYGKSCSYADIAQAIDNPKAVRAVGAANGANPIAIIVPCHRVIGKNGTMTGYAYGINMKQDLLALERQYQT